MSIWATLVTAELLPLGMWLVIYSSVHQTLRNRVLLSGITAFALSTLVFVGRVVFFQAPLGTVVDFNTSSWVFELALIQMVAVGAGVVMACYGPIWTQLPVVLMLCGLTAPLTVQWLWKDGWLNALGRNLNLGHGAIDLGGLSMMGMLIGIVALGVLLFLPRRAAQHRAPIADGHSLWAVLGALALALGAGTIFSQSSVGELGEIAQAYQLRFGLASLVASVFVLAYGMFVAGKVNWIWQARAVLASILICSAGAVTLPIWLVIGLGIACGLLVTVGDYLVNQVLCLPDEAAALAGILGPSLLGILLVGLFAYGNYGVGLNGVGQDSYMRVPNLGVVGLWSSSADPGQLSAQLIAVVVLSGLALLTTMPLIWLVRMRLVVPIFAASSDLETALETPVVPVILPTNAMSPLSGSETKLEPGPMPVAEIAASDVLPDALMPQWPVQSPLTEVLPPLATVTKTDVTESYIKHPVITSSEPGSTGVNVGAERPTNILERLRQANQRNRPEHPPARAARVAYPTRVAGKRLIRPIVEEKNSTEGNRPTDK